MKNHTMQPALPGFLLIEALIAILIITSFGCILGSYWQQIAAAQSRARVQLQAVSQAAQLLCDVLDSHSEHTQAIKNQEYIFKTISLEYRIEGQQLPEHFELLNPELMVLEATDKGYSFCLSTIVGRSGHA